MTIEARPTEKGLLNVYDIKTEALVADPENSTFEKSDSSMWGQLGAAVRFRSIRIDPVTGEFLESNSPELTKFLQRKKYIFKPESIIRQEARKLAEMYRNYRVNSEAATTNPQQTEAAQKNVDPAAISEATLGTGVKAEVEDIADAVSDFGPRLRAAKSSRLSRRGLSYSSVIIEERASAIKEVKVAAPVEVGCGPATAEIATVQTPADKKLLFRRNSLSYSNRLIEGRPSAINEVAAANIQLREDSLHPTNRHKLTLSEKLRVFQDFISARLSFKPLLNPRFIGLSVVLGLVGVNSANESLAQGFNPANLFGDRSIQAGISSLYTKPEVIVVHLPVVAQPTAEPDLPVVIPVAAASGPKVNPETATKTKIPPVAMEKVKIPKGSSISEFFEKHGFRWGWSLGDAHRLETIDLMEAEIVANWDKLISFNNELPANLADLHRLAEKARVGDIPSAEAMQDLAEGLHNWQEDAEFNYLNPDQVRETNEILAQTSNQTSR